MSGTFLRFSKGTTTVRNLFLIAIFAGCTIHAESSDVLHINAPKWNATFTNGSLVEFSDNNGHRMVTPGESLDGFQLRFQGKDYAATGSLQKAPNSNSPALPMASSVPRLPGSSTALKISTTTEAKDLLVVQTAQTPAPGLQSAQWTIAYIPLDYNIISTAGGGEKLTRTSPYKFRKYNYPLGWDAQLLIIEGKGHGFYLFGDDTHGSPKSVQVERTDKGWKIICTSENDAPFDDDTSLQARRWLLNTYQGDWRVPARRYRAWAEKAFSAQPLAAHRPSWVRDIRTFVYMERIDENLLRELAHQLDSKQTLVYLSHWRVQDFDRDCPNYHEMRDIVPSFIKLAHELGFHVMLHTNFWGVSPENPAMAEFAPYQLRDFNGKPMRYQNLNHQPPVILNYISPASKKWRDLFIAEMKNLVAISGADAIHLDQDFHAHNDLNGKIDGLTFNEGIIEFHKELRAALPDTAFGGEGLNELTYAYLDFAQRHVWSVMGGTIDRAALSIAHPIDSYLFQAYVRHYGWLGFPFPYESPQSYCAWMENYMTWGIYPTLRYHMEIATEKLANPHGFYRQLLDQAKCFQQHRLEPDLDGKWPSDVLFPYMGQDQVPVRWMTNRTLMAGKQEISRTLIDVRDVKLPGTIENWLFYSSRELFGLNPEQFYPYFAPPRNLEAPHVDSVPENSTPERGRLTPDFLMMVLQRKEKNLFDCVTSLPSAHCGLYLKSKEPYEETGGVSGRYGANLSGGSGTLALTPPSKASLATDLESTVGNKAQALGEVFASFRVKLPAKGEYAFLSGVGMDGRAVRTRQCDGMDFTIRATAGKKTLQQQLFASDDKKQDLELDLTPFAGQEITIELIAGAGPKDDATEDRGIWYAPRVVQLSPLQPGKARFAGMPDNWTQAFDQNQKLPVETTASDRVIPASPGLIVVGNRGPYPVSPEQKLASLPFSLTSIDLWGWPLPAGMPVAELHAQGDNLEIFLPVRTKIIADWLLALPSSPGHFRTEIINLSGGGGTGTLYAKVSINDVEYAGATLPGNKNPVPLTVDLSPFAGQNIVLSLILEGKNYRGDFKVQAIEPHIVTKSQ